MGQWLSNNLAERAIKPFVMGRKNWLFAHSVRGADSAAIIYSLIETCKAHDIEPFNYLSYALKQMPLAESLEDVERLLPYNCKSAI